ncbi:hypothetical protein ACFY84_25860 [Streptomyces sp. NPDC012438]|uniref:VMAP-C domain-containing protein n=1 Tax=Streptomyces sp. NPDC012438 TaxID=3364833 RepID=UPI0036E55793
MENGEGCEPICREPWSRAANDLLVDILMSFADISRTEFRNQLLGHISADLRCPEFGGGVPESPQARTHVRSMLTAAGTRSDPPAVLEALCDTLQSLTPYDAAVVWLRVTVLSVAEDKPLPADTMVPLIRALWQLKPQPRPQHLIPYTAGAGRGLSLAGDNATLPEVLERIADRGDDQGPALLARFLGSFARDTLSQHHANLEPVRSLLERTGLAADHNVPETVSSDHRLIIQIRLEPGDAPHIEDARYEVHASYYWQPRAGGRFSRVAQLADPVSLRKSELTAFGSRCLSAWAELADELSNAPSHPKRIEFILPAPLLGHPADLWVTGATRQSLGHQHPVVVRSRERYIDSLLSKQPWISRWNHLRQADGETDALDLIGWPAISTGKPTEFTSWIIERPTLACLGLQQPYERLTAPMREAVDGAMFTDGVPAMLWVRDPGEPDTLMEALRQHKPDHLTDLPDIVHQCRRQGRSAGDDDVRNHITLLWEDPDCVDSNQDHRFAGMVR